MNDVLLSPNELTADQLDLQTLKQQLTLFGEQQKVRFSIMSPSTIWFTPVQISWTPCLPVFGSIMASTTTLAYHSSQWVVMAAENFIPVRH